MHTTLNKYCGFTFSSLGDYTDTERLLDRVKKKPCRRSSLCPFVYDCHLNRHKMAPDSRCKHHIFQQVSLQADKDEHVLSAQPGNTRLSARVRVPDASKYQYLSFSRYIQTVWMSRILQKVVYKTQKQHILIM